MCRSGTFNIMDAALTHGCCDWTLKFHIDIQRAHQCSSAIRKKDTRQ